MYLVYRCILVQMDGSHVDHMDGYSVKHNRERAVDDTEEFVTTHRKKEQEAAFCHKHRKF